MERGQQYEDFEAMALYCPHCKTAMPVRKRLFLVLPEGEKYEYFCARCGSSVGDKTETKKRDYSLVIP